ncbi:MAG TPA: glycosyltransferase family 39 protein [Blastocatellia bacterium]|nr:glycosyltransferase family 39 protein [Blastocatellia bacterium]
MKKQKVPRSNEPVFGNVRLIRNPQSAFRILIPACFLLMLLLSWRRWTSLLVDTGREMDLPLRLLRGELLYRDIHYLYPPLAPYFNALLYRIFGVQLETLNVSGVLCSLAIVALCYAIARRILNEWEATLAAMAVVVWCIFKPEGNLIAPYAFAALYGMLLSLGTLLVTLRYGEQRRWREVIGAGLLIGLAGITKQEFALTAAVTWSAGLLFMHRWDWKGLLLRLLVAASLAIVIAAPVYAYFLARVGWHTLIDDCHLLYTGIPASLKFYNAARTGLDHPWSSLLQMFGGAAVALGLARLIVLISALTTKQRQLFRQCALTFVGCAAFALLVMRVSHGRWDGSPLRALPFALAGLMLIHFFRRDETKPQFALFVIAAYSLMALIRVVLRVPSGGAFGGYFLPTSLILIVYLVLCALPNLFHRRGAEVTQRHAEANSRRTSAIPLRLGGAAILTKRIHLIGTSVLSLWLVATIVVFGYRYRKTFPVLLTAPHGSLYVTTENAQATQEALNFLAANSTPDDAIAVVPEGSSLAFLAGRRMPLRHQILIPDFMDAAEEQRAIAKLAEVKYVLLLNRPMREFGLEAFGRDYYQAMGRYLDEHFRVVKMCGEVKDERLQIGAAHFFIKILARPDN